MDNMQALNRRIVQARSGGAVERSHGIRHIGSYSNAAHQWGVAMLMLQLYPEDFPRLGKFCLSHDVPESWVGDIPAPTMRYLPGLREQLGKIEGALNRDLGLPAEQDLSPEDHAKLKACDRLEFYLWAREQCLLGNMFVIEAIDEVTKYLQVADMPEPARTLFNHWCGQCDTGFLPTQAGVMEKATKS